MTMFDDDVFNIFVQDCNHDLLFSLVRNVTDSHDSRIDRRNDNNNASEINLC